MRAAASSRRAVLFDLDGTLADTGHDLAMATIDALAAIGLPCPEAGALHAYGSRGGRGMLRASWSGPWDEALFQRAFGIFLERYAVRMFESTVLYEGIAGCLEHIEDSGDTWGIVTNKGERFTRPLLAHLGLEPPTLVCGDMVPHPKPAADGLLFAASALGCAPERCVYVGDDGKDVVAAAAAGMASVVALYGYSVRLGDAQLAFADASIASPHDLAAVRQQLGHGKAARPAPRATLAPRS